MGDAGMIKNLKAHSSRWRVWVAIGLCFAGAFLAILDWATAHTVGQPCSSAVENCEKWSVTIQGPPRAAGERPDEFPIAVAIGGSTMFAGVTAVAFNTADPYSSKASWTLAAYDQNSGAESWRIFRRSRVYDSLHDIAISPDGKILVATGGAYDAFPVGATDSRIVTVAFDSASGAELWSATWDNKPDGVDNAVAVVFSPDGRSIYVGGITTETPGDLAYVTIAYDTTNGTQQWVSIYRGLGAGGTNSLFDLALSPDGKQVYVTGESAGAKEYELDYATVAYDALTGAQLWESRSQPTFVDRACCLAVDQDQVYVTGDSYSGPNGGDYQALTVALHANDGSVAWQQRLGGSGYNGGRAIAAGAGRVVVTTQSPSTGSGGGLTALTAAYDTATGNQVWVTPLAEPLRSQLANDIAIAPDGSRTYLIASSRPNAPDTALNDQELIAYDLNDGSIAWSVHLDSGAANALTGEKVAVAPDGNSVTTLGRITRSVDPLGPGDQNVYDALAAVFPAAFGPIPSPTPTPTATPTATPTVTPTPTATPTITPTASPTPTPTPTPSATPAATATVTPAPTPSATPTATATATPTSTPSPTVTPTVTPTATPTPSPTPTATPIPTATPTPTPSVTPTPIPPSATTPTVTVSVSPSSIREGSTATFTVVADRAVSQDTIVNFAMGGKALPGRDYTLSANQVRLLAGQQSASVMLNAIADGVKEKKKTAVMTLQPGSGYQFASAAKKKNKAKPPFATLKISD